jgi:SRSO17 transposase
MVASPTSVLDVVDEVPVARTVTGADLADFVDELAAYQAYYAPYFRPDQREWAAFYLRGLLTADVPRKNIEAMVLHLLGAGPAADRQVRAAQYFISEGKWADEAVLAAHWRLVNELLGEADGVLILDGSDVPKQGRHSVGVARQWCGATGKRDNCQAGVYLGYASRLGYALLDRRLYLPPAWFTDADRARWQACRIPAGTVFQTKHELATALVDGVMSQRPVAAQWVACDEGFGNDPAVLDGIARHALWYLAEVPCATLVWPLAEPDGAARAHPQRWVPPRRPGRGRPPQAERLHPDSPPRVRVDAWAAQVPADHWQRYRILEGSKGPLVAEFMTVRAVQGRDGLPGPDGWLVVRRTLPPDEEPPVYKYYLSNAPADTPERALVRVSGLRWPIEACFTEGKSEVGLDHYEVRTWRGWHHHMTLVILAHCFLMRLVLRLNQREGGLRPDGRTGAGAGGVAGAGPGPAQPAPSTAGAGQPGRGPGAPAGAAAPARVGCGGGPGLGGLPAAAQDRRLPLPPQAPAPGPPGARPMTVSL